MTVSELISKLQEFDGDMDVKIPSQTGGFYYPNGVETMIERDRFDSDWDTTVVVIE